MDQLIKFDALGKTCVCTYSNTGIKTLTAFIGMDSEFELFEPMIRKWAADMNVHRIWFTIPHDYNILLPDNHFWRAHNELVIVDNHLRILIYYAIDGKRFINNLPPTAMPETLLLTLDKKFPGIYPYIISECVDKYVVLNVIHNYVNGDFDKCTVNIVNPTIDLIWITQYVKSTLGRKFASAHIAALRLLRKKLNGDCN